MAARLRWLQLTGGTAAVTEQGREIMSRLRTIVVPTDFSETSQDALGVACEIARACSSRVHLLHVVTDLRREPWTLDGAGINFYQLQQQWVEAAERTLAGVALDPKLDPRHVTRAVVTGSPDKEIVSYAQDYQADLIVMGTHGYGGVRRFLLGSVADRVIRAAICPVVTVPPKTIRSEKDQAEAAAATTG
jgi:nucleotide-binding universal stress UspA family protein